MTVKRFTTSFLDELVYKSGASPRFRQHHNIHQSYEDPCQRVLNAIGMDSYVRPHRHYLAPRAECMIAMRGKFALIIFDDDGKVREVVKFGTEKYAEVENIGPGIEVPPGTWHTLVALVPGSVLLEMKAGPFDPAGPREFAPWAAEEGAAEARQYFEELRSIAGAVASH